jgi:8-oxo-dGTP diphosphatase
MAVRKFPSGTYGRQKLVFHPAPYRAPLRAFAGLVFPWIGDKVLVCNIEDRGWCIPSGRVEPYETSLEAVRREAVEEGGAILDNIQYIGCYNIREKSEIRWADLFVARVERLQEISMPEESKGVKLVTLDELPDLYHSWNELTRCVFEHSFDIISRSAPV